MSLKKLLFIQLDGPHFATETKLFLKRYAHELIEYDLYLCSPQKTPTILGPWIEISVAEIPAYEFELVINLSLAEESWELCKTLSSKYFAGTRFVENDALQSVGNWSSYLLQVKGGISFLPFHLQDIYKSIVGCKSLTLSEEKKWKDEVIYWQCPKFINEDVFRILIAQLKSRYKSWEFIEGFPKSDKPGFYMGPTQNQVSLWHDQNHRLMILKSHFEGMHLAPAGDNHWLVSPHSTTSDFTELYKVMIQFCEQLPCTDIEGWEVYQTTQENMFGTTLRPLTAMTHENFPFYQFHVVIWQFVLNFFDVNLDTLVPDEKQKNLLVYHDGVLAKLTQFLDFIVDHLTDQLTHFDELNFDIKKFQAAVTEIQEFEELAHKLSQNHPLLRPFLDYYRIQRGQLEFKGLKEQIQDQTLTLSEQAAVLKALHELISMTIQYTPPKIEKTSQGRERHGNDREF